MPYDSKIIWVYKNFVRLVRIMIVLVPVKTDMGIVVSLCGLYIPHEVASVLPLQGHYNVLDIVFPGQPQLHANVTTVHYQLPHVGRIVRLIWVMTKSVRKIVKIYMYAISCANNSYCINREICRVLISAIYMAILVL